MVLAPLRNKLPQWPLLDSQYCKPSKPFFVIKRQGELAGHLLKTVMAFGGTHIESVLQATAKWLATIPTSLHDSSNSHNASPDHGQQLSCFVSRTDTSCPHASRGLYWRRPLKNLSCVCRGVDWFPLPSPSGEGSKRPVRETSQRIFRLFEERSRGRYFDASPPLFPAGKDGREVPKWPLPLLLSLGTYQLW